MKLLIAPPPSHAALYIRRYLIQERQHLLPEKGLNKLSLNLNSELIYFVIGSSGCVRNHPPLTPYIEFLYIVEPTDQMIKQFDAPTPFSGAGHDIKTGAQLKHT